jgi:hypothetical protein
MKKGAWATSRRRAIAAIRSASAPISTTPATGWNGSSTGSNNVVASRRATTGLPPTTSPSFNSPQSGYGFASPRPRTSRGAPGCRPASIAPATNCVVSLTVSAAAWALGGRPAASFAKRLMPPLSKDTFLRVVRRRTRPPADPLKVIGIGRLGVAAQSPVRQHRLQLGTAPGRHPGAGS